ncbi:MAG: sensor histidine kinase, partial [Blautia sp.]|nr:sensor histidine kinase [Blautia sp.]
ERSHIRFGCMIDGSSLGFLTSMDMVSLFGNMIDNAMEAVRRLQDPEKAIINLTVRTQGHMVVIHCENYCVPGLVFENGLPVTSKEDTLFHGYGLKSMRFVAEKYGGTMTLQAEDEVFTTNILLPIP